MKKLIKFIVVLIIVINSSISFAASKSLRIVSLAPSLTDTVIDLDAANLLVGMSDLDRQRLPQYNYISSIGNFGSYSIEKIISLQPDLILAWPSSLTPSQQQQLTSLGYKIVISDPQTIDTLATEVIHLGKQIGREEQGKTLSQRIQLEVSQLRQHYARPTPITVFYQVWDKPIYTIGKHQMISDALQVCGARNIFDDIDLPSPQVSLESVLARNPQIIISSNPTILDAWKKWTQLSAVKNNKLLIFDNEEIARPSFTMLEATKELCQLLNNK